MNKIRVFLSSRVNSSFTGLDHKYSLTVLRKYIRDELEKETFLEENILEILINEDNFTSDISKNAFDNCMDVLRSCNIIIVLYNGEAGWAITDYSTNGFCHEELLVAIKEFSQMSYIIDISQYFKLPEKGPEKKRNDEFSKYVTDTFPHIDRITASSVHDLKTEVLVHVRRYILKSLEKSFYTQKMEVARSVVFGETLDWSKQTYSERKEAMLSKLESDFGEIPGLEKVILAFHAIPDNMSVADARNMIGRPFIEEHELIKKKKKVHGIIHIVAVYGNATEIQVKNLVGYPDLTVIKGTFGYYLWEKHAQIQMIFIVKCINPQTIQTRLSQLINWLRGSAELPKIVTRARARYSILDAINKAQEMEGLK